MRLSSEGEMGELLGRRALAEMAVLFCALLLAGTPAEAQDAKKGKAPKAAPPAKAAPAAPKADAAPKAEAEAPAEEPAAGGAAKSPPPSADLWILDFGFKKVGTVQPTEGIHRGEVYWYLLDRVENK